MALFMNNYIFLHQAVDTTAVKILGRVVASDTAFSSLKFKNMPRVVTERSK